MPSEAVTLWCTTERPVRTPCGGAGGRREGKEGGEEGWYEPAGTPAFTCGRLRCLSAEDSSTPPRFHAEVCSLQPCRPLPPPLASAPVCRHELGRGRNAHPCHPAPTALGPQPPVCIPQVLLADTVGLWTEQAAGRQATAALTRSASCALRSLESVVMSCTLRAPCMTPSRSCLARYAGCPTAASSATSSSWLRPRITSPARQGGTKGGREQGEGSERG